MVVVVCGVGVGAVGFFPFSFLSPQVLHELVHADEAVPCYEDLDDDAKDLVDELRERQELAAEGLIDPETFDDFRCVLSDGDGAK